MARALWLLLVLGLLLVLPGCSTTLVESLPIGQATTCDPAWPGRWKSLDQNSEKPNQGALEINSDCTEFTSIDKDGRKIEHFQLTLIATRAGEFLALPDTDRPTDCVGDERYRCGFSLYRYARAGDEIRLYEPDHERVHAAIAAGRVPGISKVRGGQSARGTSDTNAATATTANAQSAPPEAGAARTATDHGHFDNLIAGDPAQITAILVQHPEFFADEPFLILQRDGSMNPSVSMP